MTSVHKSAFPRPRFPTQSEIDASWDALRQEQVEDIKSVIRAKMAAWEGDRTQYDDAFEWAMNEVFPRYAGRPFRQFMRACDELAEELSA